MIYVYESHMGGLYAGDYELSYEQRYCDLCDETDGFVGRASDEKELSDLLKVFAEDYYDYEYIEYFFNETCEWYFKNKT